MAPRDDESSGGMATVLPLSPAALPVPGAPIVGWVVQYSPDEGVFVDWPGNDAGPVCARSVVPFDVATADEAIDSRRGAVLMFEHDDRTLPIIMGLLAEGPTVQAKLPALPLTTVDGKRVRLEGSHEIVLQCGASSIVMRRNGRIIIRGAYVETRSAGTNRIKGGSVKIN